MSATATKTPKPRYERPSLVRHQTGSMNKFTRTGAMRPCTEIDGVPISELIERYGSPLFVFSEKTLVDRYHDLYDAFTQRGLRTRIAWSYKTNYLDGICKVFHREGAWAEVVSGFEYEKALHLGIAPEQIHFNGPYKTEDILEMALVKGSHVHIDNFDELAMCEQLAARNRVKPKVALRLNLSVDSIPEWSRFGFSLEAGQARDAVARLLHGDRLQLAGLHCHLGTFIQDPEAYRQQVEKVTAFANELRERFRITLSYLDFGGGFASRNTLKGQYLPGEQVTPAFSKYAEAVARGMETLRYAEADKPTIVLETGRALVDEAGTLITTVVANKRLPDGCRALVLDAGVNVLFTSFWYKHDVIPCQKFQHEFEPTVMYGPLCMNIDVVREAVQFPPMYVGDRIAVRPVGAYNCTQWMQFITYRPAVVMIGRNRKHALLRRRENLESLISHEEVPDWL